MTLAALLAGVFPLAWQGAHWFIVGGTAIAVGAPLMFVISHAGRDEALAGHPLAVSIVAGGGCVAVMAGIQRFGTAHEWALYPAAGALIIWMLWQRGARRRHGG